MSKSKIEWTDRVWNPISGCSKVSAGCKNCYAETYAHRFWGARKFTDIMLHQDKLNYPLTIKKPTMFFVNSMSDLFHKDVSNDFITEIFTIMILAPQHTFQILTKRPERMKNFIDKFMNSINLVGNAKLLFDKGMESQVMFDYFDKRKFPENIWLGVSVEDELSMQRIEKLLKTNCANKFVSFEPLLEPIDFFNFTLYKDLSKYQINKIGWAIIGCESGKDKRDCDISWVEKLVSDLKYFDIPVFVKQINLDGKVEKDINKFPENLRIREYPKLNQNTSEEKTK